MKREHDELLRFRFLTEVRSGIGICSKLDSFIKELGSQKIVLAYDENAVQSKAAQKAISIIKSSSDMLALNTPSGEPEIVTLEKMRDKAKRFKPDAVIGLGGGSTLDMAKGLAAVLPNVKSASEYQGFDKLENKALPSIMIPTLFGSGAEVTASAVMINREKKMKGGINGRFVFPRMAVIDPELGVGAPPAILGATALDALVHCIEGYVAKCSTPVSRMFSKQATRLIVPSLFKLASEPGSIQALEDISYASLLAVMGLMHSESGICGAISYPLGVHYGVPHGLAGGLVMPKAITHNAENGCGLYGELSGDLFSGVRAAVKLADTIKHLIETFHLPSLSKYGVNEDNVDDLAGEVFGYKGIMDMNPVKIDDASVIRDIILSGI